jgi:hypothetical protein
MVRLRHMYRVRVRRGSVPGLRVRNIDIARARVPLRLEGKVDVGLRLNGVASVGRGRHQRIHGGRGCYRPVSGHGGRGWHRRLPGAGGRLYCIGVWEWHRRVPNVRVRYEDIETAGASGGLRARREDGGRVRARRKRGRCGRTLLCPAPSGGRMLHCGAGAAPSGGRTRHVAMVLGRHRREWRALKVR